jgi:hypothetical protein
MRGKRRTELSPSEAGFDHWVMKEVLNSIYNLWEREIKTAIKSVGFCFDVCHGFDVLFPINLYRACFASLLT